MTNKKSQREQFIRELQESREHHAIEVAFIRANPIHTPEVGAQKAKEFIIHLTALTEWIEALDWEAPSGSAPRAPAQDETTPAHYEVEVFFTPEQRAEVAALHARIDLVELRRKAKAYDELQESLWRIGLSEDTWIYEDGRQVDTLSIEDISLATEWFEEAKIFNDETDQ